MKNKKYLHQFILFMILSLFFVPITVQADDYKNIENYRILFLSSYSPSWDTIPTQMDGIEKALDSFTYSVEYEFMDVKNVTYSEDYEEFYDILSYKLENVSAYDGVIVGDDAALQFVQIYQQELFKDLPIVFLGIDDIENARLASEDPLVTGVVEKSDYEKNLELAQSIQPDAEHLIIIYDNSESGQGLLDQLSQNDGLFSNYEIEYLNSSDYEIDEIGEYFDNYPTEYIVFLAIMGEAIDGQKISDADAYRIVNDHIQYPIYRASRTGVGKGIFGGYIVDHFESGKVAGQMMSSILEEDKMPELMMDTPHTYIFDYNIMKQHNIQKSNLPSGALIINEPEDFIDRYSKIIINSLMFGVGALLIGLFLNTRSKNRLTLANQKLSEAEDFLTYQTYHDYLTNLPNRKNIVENLEELLKDNTTHAVIMVDIDDFKELNTAHGNAYGDQVLSILSERLLHFSKNKAIKISRFAGDEFLILVTGEKVNYLEDLVQQIQDVFMESIEVECISTFLQVSMGVAVDEKCRGSSLSIISNASLALEEAKNQGKNTIVYYDHVMRKQFTDRKKIEDVLIRAVREDGFKLLYQPQVDLQGNIVGYEALLRLKHNQFNPGEFVSVAEETDLILEIGRIVTEKAVKQLVAWREKGFDLKPISINFSNRQIRDKTYVEYLVSLLEKYKIDPSFIEIEITENIFINNDKEAKALFSKFLSKGISLSLDDFGTGYSSISYLTYLPVNKIKLDNAIVHMFINENNGAFIGNIIELAHTLGLEITIEGVETLEEYNIVKELNGDYIQGYYFSKPIEAEEIEKLPDSLM